jgi:hypothetical protein
MEPWRVFRPVAGVFCLADEEQEQILILCETRKKIARIKKCLQVM